MGQIPEWVDALKSASPAGSDLLAVERTLSNIDSDNLANFMFTATALKEKETILAILQSDPVFDKKNDYFHSRIQKIELALARGKKLSQLADRYGWSESQYLVACDLIGEATPYKLHAGMFMKTLREQSTPEQKDLFLKRAEKYEIVGCYAQTELGHGSNVRGLETTATWKPDTKSFILHSPTLTASKWWIGSLGRTANFAVVMAQLIIEGRSYGPHTFVVQVRDLKTHQPLKNVFVGDIGPKFGLNSLDNGFLVLNHVEIPHVNMLARFSKIDPETNEYIRPSNPSLVYGTMTWVRSNIVLNAGSTLAQGVTIAVRYCAVRRQFENPDAQKKQGETAVLNYSMVQYRLFPLLAAAFALHFTGRNMQKLYQANQNRQKSDLLAELHAASCALKATTSTITGEGLETCRRACGGHGYSTFAGIGRIYAEYLPTLTWEGDNCMLTQQVSRYLLKMARQSLQSESQKSAVTSDSTIVLLNYLAKRESNVYFEIHKDVSEVVKAFAWRLAFQTFNVLSKTDKDRKPWDSLLVDFWQLSTAFGHYHIVKSFHEGICNASNTGSLDDTTLHALRQLFQLLALHIISQESEKFLKSGACTTEQLDLVQDQIIKLLAQIRPHAVRLTDAWKLPDYQLDSSLGRYDGQVYEDLFYRASTLNPLNGITFDPNPASKVLFKENVKPHPKL